MPERPPPPPWQAIASLREDPNAFDELYINGKLTYRRSLMRYLFAIDEEEKC